MLSMYLAMLDEVSEKERFTKLYDKYRLLAMKISFSMLRDEVLAVDATSDAFMAMARYIKSLPPESDEAHERAYIIKVVKNTALNLRKKENGRIVPLAFEDYYESTEEYSPVNALIQEEGVRRIIGVIKGMSETYRDILIMKYVYDMSAVQISAQFGIPYDTVKSKIRRGTQILQESLSKEAKSYV